MEPVEMILGQALTAILAMLPAMETQRDARAIVIPNVAKCPRCRIVLSDVITLGAQDTGLVEHPQSAVVDGMGNYVVLQPNHGEAPIVFGPDGRFKTRVGRPGRGPGEFTAAAHVSLDPNDTLFIADWTGRMSVYGPGGMPYVRSFATPPGARAITILQDRTVVLHSAAASGTVGAGFQTYRPDGVRISAVGNLITSLLPVSEIPLIHRLAPSAAGGFWSLRLLGEYRIERWSRRGQRDATLIRRPRWYVGIPDRLRGVDTNSLDPPPSQALALWEDAVGLLWTMTLVQDPNRARAERTTRETPEGRTQAYSDVDAAWDTMVEVIDPHDGRLVSSQRFDAILARELGRGGLALHLVERPDGLYAAQVVRLSLRLQK